MSLRLLLRESEELVPVGDDPLNMHRIQPTLGRVGTDNSHFRVIGSGYRGEQLHVEEIAADIPYNSRILDIDLELKTD